MQFMVLDRYKIIWVFVCLSFCLCPFVRPKYLSLSIVTAVLSDLPQTWNVGHTSDKEEYVGWPVTPEVVNAHARQFTSGLAYF